MSYSPMKSARSSMTKCNSGWEWSAAQPQENWVCGMWPTNHIIIIDGQDLKKVDCFKYLFRQDSLFDAYACQRCLVKMPPSHVITIHLKAKIYKTGRSVKSCTEWWTLQQCGTNSKKRTLMTQTSLLLEPKSTMRKEMWGRVRRNLIQVQINL